MPSRTFVNVIFALLASSFIIQMSECCFCGGGDWAACSMCSPCFAQVAAKIRTCRPRCMPPLKTKTEETQRTTATTVTTTTKNSTKTPVEIPCCCPPEEDCCLTIPCGFINWQKLITPPRPCCGRQCSCRARCGPSCSNECRRCCCRQQSSGCGCGNGWPSCCANACGSECGEGCCGECADDCACRHGCSEGCCCACHNIRACNRGWSDRSNDYGGCCSCCCWPQCWQCFCDDSNCF